MNVFKKVLVGIVALIMALIALVVVFVSTIDPNTLRPEIQGAISESTGATLEFDVIEWQFWPSLGFKITGVDFSTSQSEHAQLLQVDKAAVEIALVPLLRGTIEIVNINLDGPKVWFHQFPSGRHNWQPLLDHMASRSAPDEPVNGPADDVGAPLKVQVNEMRLRNGEIYITGTESLKVSDLNLSLHGVGFDRDIAIKLTSQIEVLEQQFDLALSAGGIYQSDANQVRLNNLDVVLTNLLLQETLAASGYFSFWPATSRVETNLEVAPFNLDAWLGFTPQTAEATTSDDSTKNTPNQSPPTPIPTETLRSLQLDARVHLQGFQLRSVPHALTLHLKAHQGLVEIENFILNGYDGEVSGSLTLDARPAKPVLNLDMKVSEMAMEQLSRAWLQATPVTGQFSSSLDLMAEGTTVEAMMSQVIGDLGITMADAQLPTINVQSLVWSSIQAERTSLLQALSTLPEVNAVLETLKTPKVLRGETRLQTILAQIQMTPSRIESQELTASLNGQPISGRLSYGRQTQDFVLDLALRMPFKNSALAEIAWPVRCKAVSLIQFGCSLDAAKLKPILNQLTREAARHELNRVLEPPTSEAKAKAKEELKSLEEEVKSKLEGKVGDSLKGLFK